MQYETIILELMSRIKTLETDVANMKADIQSLEVTINSLSESNTDFNVNSPIETTDSTSPRNTTTYMKMTEHMMDVCYTYGKKAYESSDANIGYYADLVAEQTGMNRSSAFMYIYGVKNLLEGKVFKRAISTKALRKYFSTIYNEFGKAGLTKALQATKANIEYRDSCGLSSDSIIALYEEFENML
ncbi:MAG: hypothetical protein IJB64_09805 [Akkermansia sp.]|nr:hypothetical protein [Akkermansia sp.]